MKISNNTLKIKGNITVAKLFFLITPFLLFASTGFTQIKSTVNPTTRQNSFVMCEIMPGADVAAKTPFTLAFKSMESWPTANVITGCRYIFKNEEEEAGVSIGLTDLGSKKNALTSYNNAFQASKDLWEETPTSVIILQDTGFFSGKDICGLKFHLGKYVLDINLKGQYDVVSDEQKKEYAKKLAEMVMERLKYLWKN